MPPTPSPQSSAHAPAHTPNAPASSAVNGASPSVPGGMPKAYRPIDTEAAITARWDASTAFHADPARILRGEAQPYCIFIPPPNVTAALHLGHALNNTLQDVLIRAHRMMGFETLWMPGTDHAGIATQAVVEKRVLKEEGKRRKDFQRDEFVAKIQAYKDEYEAIITTQLKAMGCSCDWPRQRFTMDDQCAAAVREAFFRLFKDGLIYRGKRLVNWDPALQTAVADDECFEEDIDAAFYYMRYPLVHGVHGGPALRAGSPITWSDLAKRGYPGASDHPAAEQAFVTVATTRPETYLGDAAVAINPNDPRAKALEGLWAQLPLIGRRIPIIADDYVVLPKAMARTEEEANDPKAEFATGFLKVTPAHDQNDYDLYQRHKAAIDANTAGTGLINVMAPDASISDKHGWSDTADAREFLGLTREKARKAVVESFKSRGLLEGTRPYRQNVKKSDRSKAIIEPYLSDQWYVKVTDDRMAGSALRAMATEQRKNSEAAGKAEKSREKTGSGDGSLTFYPDRYAKTFEHWHENIRDWCISRQLWWGHRIPVWTVQPFTHAGGIGHPFDGTPNPLLDDTVRRLETCFQSLGLGGQVCIRRTGLAHTTWLLICSSNPRFDSVCKVLNSLSDDTTRNTQLLRESGLAIADSDRAIAAIKDVMGLTDSTVQSLFGLEQDPDVLDTWFSSALWPLSTLGWPNPATYNAESNAGMLEAYNPSSVLCTAREIITLWVSRMVMFNRYFFHDGHGSGPIPFKDVFIHAMIQDGDGRKMSKSLGNGVDPRDIIESHGADAMRFTLVQMTTQTQDVRMPVSPDPKSGKNTSPKFDIGRNFCNKLWNAARFTLGILGAAGTAEANEQKGPLSLVDRWMLSRLESSVREVNAALQNYEFSVYAQTMYDLLWRDFCDWYLEAIKPTAAANPQQRAVLAHALESILRLLHPITPFVTEAIWEHIRTAHTAPIAGIDLAPARKNNLLCTAGWPKLSPTLRDETAEREFEEIRTLVTAIREVRAAQQVADKRKIRLHAPPLRRRGLRPRPQPRRTTRRPRSDRPSSPGERRCPRGLPRTR